VKSTSRLTLLSLAIAAVLVTAIGASARPAPQQALPPSPGFFTPPGHVVTPGPRLEVSQLSSAPVDARPGRAYTLTGVAMNSGTRAASGPLTINLLRVGVPPIQVGRTAVSVGAHRSAAYTVRVALPRGLGKGSYMLVACSQRGGATGPLGCATAERHIQVGPAKRIRVLADEAPDAAAAACSSGAHTLSLPGSHVYPETGNGGYTSVHTDVYMVYDAATNLFLPGNHVDLTDRATQCLTDFSLDFERTSANLTAGPNMTVGSVTVNGQPASFTFVQPTYPGDPNGQDDPDPAAHQASQLNPVGGPASNPLPPACAPELLSTSSANQNSLNGTPCPANKLVITPSAPIPAGATFVVTVNYTGRPGVHNDGDGTTEGWFRSNNPVGDGGFVTTEPVGTEDWMPLNNHPSAKPSYDFYDTVNTGKTAIGNGALVGFTDNLPDPNFPGGSRTWHWHSPEGIAAYLVENSVGAFDLTERLASSGILYYTAQGSSIIASRKATNQTTMNQQEDITLFQSMFNGPFPFTTDGVVIGVPSASFEEEMQTKITFAGGSISLGTFNHENMHQWWGDNVAEGQYNLTFFKEGMATLGEYLNTARTAATAAGGLGTPAGDAAFQTSLVNRFNTNYANTGSLWTAAPSDPRPFTLFTTATTYTRPGTAYLALRQILGASRFTSAMQQIQRDYGGASITEAQLEAGFKAFLPNPTPACQSRLDQFFTQWFDTVYPTGGGLNKPQITGPGLNGPGFACAPTITYTLDPATPSGAHGWYTGDVTVTWHVDDGGSPVTKTGCVDQSFVDGTTTVSCSATNAIGSADPVSVTVQRDTTKPVVTYTGNAGAYTVDQTIDIHCAASDPSPGSGLESTTCEDISGPAWSFTLGSHTFSASAQDVAGNVGTKSTTFTIGVTFSSLEALVSRFSTSLDVATGLNDKLIAASKAKSANTRGNQLNAFANQVNAQTGKALTEEQAQLLLALAATLQ
jgi:hypothetical protein